MILECAKIRLICYISTVGVKIKKYLTYYADCAVIIAEFRRDLFFALYLQCFECLRNKMRILCYTCVRFASSFIFPVLRLTYKGLQGVQ